MEEWSGGIERVTRGFSAEKFASDQNYAVWSGNCERERLVSLAVPPEDSGVTTTSGNTSGRHLVAIERCSFRVSKWGNSLTIDDAETPPCVSMRQSRWR